MLAKDKASYTVLKCILSSSQQGKQTSRLHMPLPPRSLWDINIQGLSSLVMFC